MRLTRVEYLIRGLHTIHYFTCDDWHGVNNQASGEYRSKGYSDRLLVHTHSPLNGSSRCQIHRHELIGYLTDTDNPMTGFLFPIHYEDRAFGFLCLRFTESCYAPDGLFWSWIQLLSNALETLRIRSYLIRFSECSLESILHTMEIRLNKKHLNDRRRELPISNIHELHSDFYKHPEHRWHHF